MKLWDAAADRLTGWQGASGETGWASDSWETEMKTGRARTRQDKDGLTKRPLTSMFADMDQKRKITGRKWQRGERCPWHPWGETKTCRRSQVRTSPTPARGEALMRRKCCHSNGWGRVVVQEKGDWKCPKQSMSMSRPGLKQELTFNVLACWCSNDGYVAWPTKSFKWFNANSYGLI